jgi:hypothetical protein
MKSFLLAGLFAAASLPALACYTVYDRANRVMYQGDQPPVDMSRPVHETVPARFPGGTMIFDTSTSCPSLVASAARAPTRTGSTLLTDERTAQAMGVQYTAMAGGLAVVQAGEARMKPGVTVVPSRNFDVAVASAPDTRSMGGPPSVTSRSTVITEMRNPPLTVIQRDGVVVTETPLR